MQIPWRAGDFLVRLYLKNKGNAMDYEKYENECKRIRKENNNLISDFGNFKRGFLCK